MRKASRIRGNLLYVNNTSLGDIHSKFILATTQTLHIYSFSSCKHSKLLITGGRSHPMMKNGRESPAVDNIGTSGLVLRHTQYPELLSMLAFGVQAVCLNWLSQIWNLADWSCVEQWNYSDENQKSKNFHSTDSKNDKRVNSKDGLAASPVCNLPDPRGLLSFAILAKAITEAISKCRRQLKAWLEVCKHGPYKYRPALLPEIGKYVSQHGEAAAAQGFSRKLLATSGGNKNTLTDS